MKINYAAAFALLSLSVASTASAKLVEKPVAYEQGGVKLEGRLYYDDVKVKPKGKAPGVLVIPEWWGVNDYVKSRGKAIAQLGYVAFVVDMYGAAQSTEDGKQAGQWAGQFYGKPLMAERANAALEQLVKSGLVDPTKVAAIGFCFGGTTSMALAYSGAPLAGVVAFHAGLLNAPAPAAGGDKVKTKFLVLQGAVDPHVKADDRKAFEAALEADKVDYQYVEYAGAKHAFSNPDADRLATKNNMTAAIGYNEPAARRSWTAMQVFFTELFGK